MIFDGDVAIANYTVQYLDKPNVDFLFVYFASIDVAGHEFGWLTTEYIKQVSEVDKLVGQVVAKLSLSTTILIHADHGGHDHTHGTNLPEDMTIPWMIRGENIKSNYRLESDISLLDTAPLVAYSLGIPPHPDWQGKIRDEIFKS